MEIRAAIESDIPAIVELLKSSLGEGLMPKSDQYWKWKHLANPFGISPVLLAVENDTLIGVRAFMRWRWRQASSILEAVRAVDTATHPAYQGKGIFSKLTKALLADCEKKGLHFVFNTPNSKSKPGYLKMGWEEAGKLPINLQLIRPFRIGKNLILKSVISHNSIPDDSVARYLNHPGLEALIRSVQFQQPEKIVTDYNVDALRWRYQTVPVATYHAGGIESAGTLHALFFYRIKVSKLGREMRVTDIITVKDSSNDIRELILERAVKNDVDYITCGGSMLSCNVLKGFLSFSNVEIGPIVTVRNINLKDLERFRKFSLWSPSVGDLELF